MQFWLEEMEADSAPGGWQGNHGEPNTSLAGQCLKAATSLKNPGR